MTDMSRVSSTEGSIPPELWSSCLRELKAFPRFSFWHWERRRESLTRSINTLLSR